MKIYQELLKLSSLILKPIIVLNLCIFLVACDKGGFDLPTNTGKYPVTGGNPPDGELIDPNIGLDGRWETYCEVRVKYIYEIKGTTLKEEMKRFSGYDCTPEGEDSSYVIEDTFTLKAPLTTPSGLTAYPVVHYMSIPRPKKDLIVLHGDTLYWQKNAPTDDSHPADINLSTRLEFHRIK